VSIRSSCRLALLGLVVALAAMAPPPASAAPSAAPTAGAPPVAPRQAHVAPATQGFVFVSLLSAATITAAAIASFAFEAAPRITFGRSRKRSRERDDRPTGPNRAPPAPRGLQRVRDRSALRRLARLTAPPLVLRAT
jgi:hypothetical protein